MTVEEISRAASSGAMPDGLTCPERCLFYALREVYRQFNTDSITKEKGRELKESAVRQFQKDVEDYNAGKQILTEHAKMWAGIERTANTYRKEPTIENADRFLEAVYGCGRKV